MKKFKITLECELELPNDFEIAPEPENALLCLKRGKKFYRPVMEWVVRGHYVSGAVYGFESAPVAGWESVDDDIGNEFIDATASEDHSIEQVHSPKP